MDKTEFDLIKSYFAPLTCNYPEAYNLRNDAALINEGSDRSTVVTMDTLVEGIHFFSTDPPEDIARKSLRVNLSDLAAMGANPKGYTLSISYNTSVSSEWVKAFTKGLAADQEIFECHLIGGDTVSTPGPLTIALTCFGSVPRNKCLHRTTGRLDDDIWVSGTIGDSAAGLKLLKKEIKTENSAAETFLVNRYRIPQPRTLLGIALLERDICQTALDVSDGLIADINHIAEGSNLQARIFLSDIPLSDAFRDVFQGALDQGRQLAVTGGDDYEILFTSKSKNRSQVFELSEELDIPITQIGTLTQGNRTLLLDKSNKEITVAKSGWTHF
ncbi:thiamine-phosphate kinase [Kiloniella sp. EL199]|uniref:thiamine-phosphate kinase n=1 Tax=Kiloniella sp. EL199 TaxID=2107581 RepID=UPI000EA30B38|nr:thiamine-phosphate kinase [Kiloniella sp. EL199]